jgi:hypothetical protein
MAQGKDQHGSGRQPHGADRGTAHGGPHGKDDRAHGGSHGGSQTRSHEASTRERDREMEADLKRREYRGEDGQLHHHTHPYMEQHAHDRGGHQKSEGAQGGGRDDNRSQGSEHTSAGGDHPSRGRDDHRAHDRDPDRRR